MGTLNIMTNKNNPTQKMREEISKILVKNNMPTRQVAISEINELITQARKEGYEEGFKHGLEAGTPMIHNKHK